MMTMVTMWRVLLVTITFAATFTTTTEALPDIQPLLEQLASNSQQANIWRRLGKIQLDAGEFAEARRIFCQGSECCPSDDALKHHVKVFQFFHERSSDNDNDDIALGHPPFLQEEVEPSSIPEFLSLQVPPSAIPESIQKQPGEVPPGQRTRLIHASKEPILSKEACDYLIQAAKQTTDKIGWTKNRHVQAPTCDVPVFNLASAPTRWLCKLFHQFIFPLLCRLVAPELDIDPSDLRVQDCFIVRYDANEKQPGFASLNPHQDESLLSLTIVLNDDYQEGGLYMASTQDVLDGPAGTVLCFAGGLVHGGYPIASGTRWILTVFLYVDSNQSEKPPGYTLDRLKELAREKRGKQNM